MIHVATVKEDGMYRIGNVAWFSSGGFAPFMDAPDAGAGGGGTDPVEGGDGTPPPVGDLDAGDALPSAGTDDDEDDDEDLREDGDITPERFKRVAKKLKKQNRRVQKLTASEREYAPLRAHLAELREQGISLDDLKYGHRQFRELSQQIANNPQLKKLVHGDVAAEDARAGKEPEPEPEFDESALPFEPDENPTNRYFADLAKANHELRQTQKKLEARLNQIDGRDTERTERAERATWKSAIDAAAQTLEDEMVRILFKDAMTAAYQDRARHKLPPDRIIAHYLKGKVTTRQAATATAAAAAQTPKPAATRTAATQQRMAEANKTLPRTVAPSGTPAPARNHTPTMAELRKRIAATGR